MSTYLKPIRVQTRWIDAVAASAQPTPDGWALSFYEGRNKTGTPNAVIFLTARQWSDLKRQEVKPAAALASRSKKKK